MRKSANISGKSLTDDRNDNDDINHNPHKSNDNNNDNSNGNNDTSTYVDPSSLPSAIPASTEFQMKGEMGVKIPTTSRY